MASSPWAPSSQPAHCCCFRRHGVLRRKGSRATEDSGSHADELLSGGDSCSARGGVGGGGFGQPFGCAKDLGRRGIWALDLEEGKGPEGSGGGRRDLGERAGGREVGRRSEELAGGGNFGGDAGEFGAAALGGQPCEGGDLGWVWVRIAARVWGDGYLGLKFFL